ncbi:MAG: putative metallopeptidase [Nanoarchaeota archaeon]
MKYDYAPDLKTRLADIVNKLQMNHVDVNRVECLRSFGSSTKRTLARCHTIGKVMQKGMKTGAFYTIEFLEKFDKLSFSDQDKVIIHELLHIPKTFGGGFRQHDFVCDENIEKLHRHLRSFGKLSF